MPQELRLRAWDGRRPDPGTGVACVGRMLRSCTRSPYGLHEFTRPGSCVCDGGVRSHACVPCICQAQAARTGPAVVLSSSIWHIGRHSAGDRGCPWTESVRGLASYQGLVHNKCPDLAVVGPGESQSASRERASEKRPQQRLPSVHGLDAASLSAQPPNDMDKPLSRLTGR